MDSIETVKFDEKGLVPAIMQDYDSGEVLMLAYMNKESLKLTMETGRTCFYSRSRQKLWIKGETSGNFHYCPKSRHLSSHAENMRVVCVIVTSGVT